MRAERHKHRHRAAGLLGAAALLAAAAGIAMAPPALAQLRAAQPAQSTTQSTAQSAPASSGLLPPAQGRAILQALPDFAAPDSPLARAGTATEAEGGPTVPGPLGDPVRRAGPATAVFGATLFNRGAPAVTDAPNPNYIIGVGDRVSVRVWGAVEAEAVGIVDPDGNLFLPSIGPIRLAGTRAGDLQRVVEAEVRRIYTQQVQVYAVLLSASRVGVFVTGFVRSPGRHLGAGSDTVLDFLSRANGVDPARGSYRDIEVRRGGRVVAKVDLYRFLLTGTLPRVNLQEGDTILVARQGATVSAEGAVRNNFLFEVSGRTMPGRELAQLAGPLPAATNAVIRGSRNGRPFSRYASVQELANLNLMDQDEVAFITDAPLSTVRVTIEGSRIGPSVLVADRDMTLCALLDHVAVDPALADTRSVFLLRPRLAAQQMRTINEAMDRLERQLFMAVSATTGVAEIRATEAQLVSAYIQRARRVQPEGRLVVMDRSGRCAPVRLEDGDTIVIPDRTETVLVGGEVMAPQAVVWRPGMRLADYIRAAGGFASRGDESQIMIRKASGELVLEPTDPPGPGDELIALPRLDPKNFQITRDLLQLVFQTALSARVFM